MDLTQLTPAELDKLTKDQLIAGILEGQTYSDVNLVKDKDGNNVELTEVTRDAYGKVLATKAVKWSYYDAGAGTVNEITVDEGKERLIVKHTLDGKQPTATKQLITEPTPMER